jgi:hypothetical protein
MHSCMWIFLQLAIHAGCTSQHNSWQLIMKCSLGNMGHSSQYSWWHCTHLEIPFRTFYVTCFLCMCIHDSWVVEWSRCVEIAPGGFSDASKTLATIVSLWVQVCMPTKIVFLSWKHICSNYILNRTMSIFYNVPCTCTIFVFLTRSEMDVAMARGFTIHCILHFIHINHI